MVADWCRLLSGSVCLLFSPLEMSFGFGIRIASAVGVLIGLVCWGLAAGLAGS